MKKNKILALVLTAALSLGLLAGCGGNTASAEKPDSTPTEASSKAPEQQTEAPEVSADVSAEENSVAESAAEAAVLLWKLQRCVRRQRWP